MEDQLTIYNIINNYIKQNGYEMITPEPDVSSAVDISSVIGELSHQEKLFQQSGILNGATS